jgi:hypothetical protein
MVALLSGLQMHVNQLDHPSYRGFAPSVTMATMKRILCLIFVLLAVMAFAAPRAAAQTGSIEFVARATPSGGLEEPVRGFPFYVLTKSFEDISKEADAEYPKPDMDAYIDRLDVSDELKAWMKKNQWVMLSGEDFIHKLHTADIMNVPEFYKAYLERNAETDTLDFPKPKYKPSDKIKDPTKFEKLSSEYKDAVRHYVDENPQSIDGIDLSLEQNDPSRKWNDLEGKRVPQIQHKALELAQSRYLVARTETNLQGQGFLRGVAVGRYWLSTLDVAATVGDARPRWDVPLEVRAGNATYVVLSNVNAVQPAPPPAN